MPNRHTSLNVSELKHRKEKVEEVEEEDDYTYYDSDKFRKISRNFHRNKPPNPFYKEKVPWKTIIVVSLALSTKFFVGLYFLFVRDFLPGDGCVQVHVGGLFEVI